MEKEELGNEKKETDKKSDKTKEDNDKGSEPKTNTLVDDTNLAAKRMEDATAAAKEERLKSEENYEKMKLSGTTDAGQAPKKLTDKEIASRKRIKAVADISNSSWAKDYE